MDKALVFGTKDCRFESCQGHEYCSDSRLLSVLLDHNHTQCGDCKERSDPLPLQVHHPCVGPSSAMRHTKLLCVCHSSAALGHLQVRGTSVPACKNDTLTAVGFEPTQLALVELESTPLDHSGKLSCSAARSRSMELANTLGGVAAFACGCYNGNMALLMAADPWEFASGPVA